MYLEMLLEHRLAWGCDPLPGDPVPVKDHPLCKELFPNTQPELPLRQLYTIPSGAVARHRRGEISASLCAPPPDETM